MADMTKSHQSTARRHLLPLMALTAMAMLAACSKQVEKAEPIRPVRAIQVVPDRIDVIAEFPGEVRPRIESRLGFRVGGKIVARKVDVGSLVKRGQVLMQLDPQDLQLAQAQSNAGLKAAESNHELARAELARYRELREKNFVSQAVLDGKETAYQAARATFEQAAAAYRNQANQTGYTSLVADVDGVVTAIEAEAGQVVAAGTPVVRLAQLSEKEIVIAIPEDKVDSLRRVADVKIRLWAMPNASFAGKIREISPVADAATRTYTARVAMPNPPADIKLGMTAYVTFAVQAPAPQIKLPMTALFQDKNNSAVWVIDKGAVRLAPVQVAGPVGNEILIASGISPGQTVVTAGVNLLQPGQKVSILGADSVVSSDAAVAALPSLPIAHDGAIK